jgi:hypothetical protein
MSELAGLLNNLRARLDKEGVRFVVGGSFALAARGHARSTDDLDVMVMLQGGDLTPVHRALQAPPSRFTMVNEATFRDEETLLLLDLIPVRDEAQREVFDRAAKVELDGAHDVRFLTAEGIAVMLLREATLGAAQKRRQRLADLDALAGANPGLDKGYIRSWAERMGYDGSFREWTEPNRSGP